MNHRGNCMRCGEDTNRVELTLEIVGPHGERFMTVVSVGKPLLVCVDCRDQTRDSWNAILGDS